MRAAGSILYYTMLYHCYRSYLPILEQDPLSLLVQRLGGWFTPRQDCVDYFVPESYAYMCYLLDSSLVRQAHLDYID